jgi:hypothetical protein
MPVRGVGVVGGGEAFEERRRSLIATEDLPQKASEHQLASRMTVSFSWALHCDRSPSAKMEREQPRTFDLYLSDG